jgi:hypothetical protein
MRGLEAGSVDYVKKPFNRRELLSRIKAQIRSREIVEAELETRKLTGEGQGGRGSTERLPWSPLQPCAGVPLLQQCVCERHWLLGPGRPAAGWTACKGLLT